MDRPFKSEPRVVEIVKEIAFRDIVRSVGDIGYYIGKTSEDVDEKYRGKFMAGTIDSVLMGIRREHSGSDGCMPWCCAIDTGAIAKLHAFSKLGIDIEIRAWDDQFVIIFPGFALKDGDLVNEEGNAMITGFSLDDNGSLEVAEGRSGRGSAGAASTRW